MKIKKKTIKIYTLSTFIYTLRHYLLEKLSKVWLKCACLFLPEQSPVSLSLETVYVSTILERAK